MVVLIILSIVYKEGAALIESLSNYLIHLLILQIYVVPEVVWVEVENV